MFLLPTPSDSNVCPLVKNDIHIWLIKLSDISSDKLTFLHSLLSASELKRNAGYKFGSHRKRDTVCRGLLRLVLSNYLGQTPSSLKFSSNAYGKPSLDDCQINLQFNLSHSGDYIACAVTLDSPIGIDVETKQRKNNVMSIADHYFTGTELADILAQTGENRHSKFFEYWTLKEAYIKARGLGLAIPLDQFSFSFTSDNKISIDFDEAIDDSVENWSFWLWPLGADYKLALAVQQIEAIQNTLVYTHIPDG